MAELAIRTLQYRSERLRTKLLSGTPVEVKAAREMLRLSLVELYGLGYWQAHPDQLRDYMRLYRTMDASVLIAPPSTSPPSRMDRYGP